MPIRPQNPQPAEPQEPPVQDPQPYKDPVSPPPSDPQEDRPLQDPQPPATDRPRLRERISVPSNMTPKNEKGRPCGRPFHCQAVVRPLMLR